MGALLIKAFAGGVLGGLNSLIGVFLGCLALGVAENLAGAYLSPSFADAITFIIIIAVLIAPARRHFRPRQGAQGMSAAAEIRQRDRAPSPAWGAALVGVCLLLACAAPLGLNGYGLYLLTLDRNFRAGGARPQFADRLCRQISLCHASFFGVGAYATAILTQKAGLPYLVSLLVGRVADHRDRRARRDPGAAAEKHLSCDCDARLRRGAAEDHLRVAQPDRRWRRDGADGAQHRRLRARRHRAVLSDAGAA